MMRISFLIISFICLFQGAYGQIYQLFYFINDIPFQYDTNLQVKADKAMEYYYQKNDSAIIIFEQLYKEKPSYRLEYNLAVAYSKILNKSLAFLYLSKYVSNEDKCECAYLDNSSFKILHDEMKYIELKNKCAELLRSKGIKDVVMYSKLACLDGKEQEILGLSRFKDVTSDRIKIFNEFISLVDTLNFPSEEKITQRGINFFQLLLLHSDNFPEMQVNIAKKIISLSDNYGYNKKNLAYTIDRGLSNLNRPQQYGTIISKNPKNDLDCLYQYDCLEDLQKRRSELGFQPYQDFLINKSILK